MEVSIIVPFDNRAAYLRACIEGVLAQEFSLPFEVWMVDNNSSDGSVEIVRQYPRLNPLHQPKQGGYAARNLAARHATGKYLAFLDADCVPDPQWLAGLHEAFQTPGVGMAIGAVWPATSRGALQWIGEFAACRDRLVNASNNPRVYYARGGNMAVSREIFQRFGPFDERLRGGDVALAQRLAHALSCDAVVFAPSARVRHLEVHNLASFLRKMYVHGRTMESWRPAMDIEALPFSVRWQAFKQTAHPSLATRVGLLLCLAAGSAAWWYGARTIRAGRR